MKENDASELITLYSDVQATRVNWFWYPFIAYGKITLLQGDPGDGKSTMMMQLIAELSKGGKTPDGQALGRPQRSIYQCSEDGAADTIKPRLERCGADCTKIAFIDEELHEGITLDDERLRQAIADYHPKMVVIDPIQAYIVNPSDLQLAIKARKIMRRLSAWAAAYDCAIVLIGHMNKQAGIKGLYRSLGSIDMVAAARSVLQIERDSLDSNVRIVHQIKNSLAPSDAKISFELREKTGFRWIVNEPFVMCKEETNDPEISKTEKNIYFIKMLLKDGKVPSNEMYEKLKKVGIGRRTAEKLRREMGIVCKRDMKCWYWSLPGEDGF